VDRVEGLVHIGQERLHRRRHDRTGPAAASRPGRRVGEERRIRRVGGDVPQRAGDLLRHRVVAVHQAPDLAPDRRRHHRERQMGPRRTDVRATAAEAVQHIRHGLGEPPVEREAVRRAGGQHPAPVVRGGELPRLPGHRAGMADVQQEQHARAVEVTELPGEVVDLPVLVEGAVPAVQIEGPVRRQMTVGDHVHHQHVVRSHPTGRRPDGRRQPGGRQRPGVGRLDGVVPERAQRPRDRRDPLRHERQRRPQRIRRPAERRHPGTQRPPEPSRGPIHCCRASVSSASTFSLTAGFRPAATDST
jgi:hypothetical protein